MAITSNQLQEVRELIKSGKRKTALAKIASYIEKDHDNPELWWLLANATEDPHRAIRALDQMESLRPGDPRVAKLRKKIDTRRVLSEMGVHDEAAKGSVNTQKRVLFFAGFAGLAFMAVAAIIVTSVLSNRAGGEIADLPTQQVLPTETATEIPTETAVATTEVATTVPTDEIDGALAAENTQEAPDGTQPTSVALVSDLPTPENTQDLPPERTPVVTVDTAPPTPGNGNDDLRGTDSLAPESTQDSIPLPPSPEGTQDALNTTSDVPLATSTPQVILSNAESKGQIIAGEPRRVLIVPYGEHTYTFSGYRDEHIVLELVNVSGKGNPSLVLMNSAEEIVEKDIDTTNATTNLDAKIDLVLPTDGIYTVVVRMASVEEQLYVLTLTR
jgi:hypothetical protein